jgi:hypothetical protein
MSEERVVVKSSSYRAMADSRKRERRVAQLVDKWQQIISKYSPVASAFEELQSKSDDETSPCIGALSSLILRNASFRASPLLPRPTAGSPQEQTIAASSSALSTSTTLLILNGGAQSNVDPCALQALLEEFLPPGTLFGVDAFLLVSPQTAFAAVVLETAALACELQEALDELPVTNRGLSSATGFTVAPLHVELCFGPALSLLFVPETFANVPQAMWQQLGLTKQEFHFFCSCAQSLTTKVVTDRRATDVPTADKISAEPPRDSATGLCKTFPAVPGLFLLEEFVTPQEEADLLTYFSLSVVSGWEWLQDGRRVIHMNRRFIYGPNTCGPPLIESTSDRDPHLLPTHPTVAAILDRVRAFCGNTISCEKSPLASSLAFDQITINCYPPGAGISRHVDAHAAFEDVILSITVGSSAVMIFRDPERLRAEEVLLLPRSVLVMSGPARYCWTHGIAKRKVDMYQGVPHRRGLRYSITCRSAKEPPHCSPCPEPRLCDAHPMKS